MRARFHKTPAIQYENAICRLDGGQAVGDDQCGTALLQLFQCFLNKLFTLRIKGTGSFIEQQDWRIA